MTGPNSPHYFSLKNAKKRPKNSAKNIKNIKNAHFCRASAGKFFLRCSPGRCIQARENIGSLGGDKVTPHYKTPRRIILHPSPPKKKKKMEEILHQKSLKKKKKAPGGNILPYVEDLESTAQNPAPSRAVPPTFFACGAIIPSLLCKRVRWKLHFYTVP